MRPGINWSLPAPFDAVQIVDVEEIRTIDIPTGTGEKLVLTGDQNIVDLAYSVRWNIRDAALYKFQLVDPEQTIREVAESAMRSIVATVSLNDTIGRSEEHTSELQSLMSSSYAVFCLQKKNI